MERIIVICVGLALLLGGCAHSHNTFFYPDGKPCAETISTVFGTGETEKYVVMVPCGITEMYDTKDTGVSENAGKLAEGLAKGAVKGIVPTP